MPNPALHISIDLQFLAQIPLLQHGQSHPQFADVQRFLQKFGYLDHNLPITGDLDPPTVGALREFQRFHAVSDGNGNFDAATRDLMSKPRCALSDPVGGVGFSLTCAWGHRDLTFAFGEVTTQVDPNAARDAVRNAFATLAACGVGLSFKEVSDADHPDILIEWRGAKDPDLSMKGGTIAHADFPPGCRVIGNNLPLPVHFDDEEHTWVVGAVIKGLDIETVALHEIGHCLGLQHTNVKGAVMYPYTATNSTLRSLQSDDIAALETQYPRIPQPSVISATLLELLLS